MGKEIFWGGQSKNIRPIFYPVVTKTGLTGTDDIKLLSKIANDAPKNVSVLGWADAATFWSAVDCTISTSDNEGMPIALIEAQLAGIPAIATNVGSNSEVINDGVTGVVTSKDVDALVSAVQKLVKQNELRISMGKEAKVWAEENFSLKKMLNSHRQAYEFHSY